MAKLLQQSAVLPLGEAPLLVESAEPPENAAALRQELLMTELVLRLTGLAFLGWTALKAAGRLRDYELQLASFERSHWSWLQNVSTDMALPLVLGISLCFLWRPARLEGNALAVFWVLTVQWGLVPAIYMLRLLNSKSARRVLAPRYAAVCQATRDQESGIETIALAVAAAILLVTLAGLDAHWAQAEAAASMAASAAPVPR